MPRPSRAASHRPRQLHFISHGSGYRLETLIFWTYLLKNQNQQLSAQTVEGCPRLFAGAGGGVMIHPMLHGGLDLELLVAMAT